MCGVVGYSALGGLCEGIGTLEDMLATIRHRGPDDEGITLFHTPTGEFQNVLTPGSEAGAAGGKEHSLAHDVAFGHRRFSILGLGPTGHQPFWTAGNEICVSFNGEIYNYVEVARELSEAGRQLRTNSDTEVLAEAFLEWGVECFSRLNGIWAASILDRRSGRLLLTRDRIGKIPLYTTLRDGRLWWASEIKALLAAVGPDRFTIDDQSVADFVVGGRRDHFQRTLYEGVRCLPPATYVWVNTDGTLEEHRYWSIPEERWSQNEYSREDAVTNFRSVLEDALRIRLRADVPIGFELSGGMDSSSLVALGTRLSDQPVHAYTVSFPGSSSDEEHYARSVATHFGDRVEYEVVLPGELDFFEEADDYVALMEEPFHSPNMLANQAIWRTMQRHGIRVAINGGGGDEALAGYGYDYFEPYLKGLFRSGSLVTFAREFLLYKERPRTGSPLPLLRQAYHLLPDALRPYRNRTRELPPEWDPFRRGSIDPYLGPSSTDVNQILRDNMTDARMNYWLASDNQSYMGVPVELRLPFLDYRLVELAFQMPLGYLIRDGWMKWVLRETMRDELPRDVMERRQKMGFPFPFLEWLPENKDRFFAVVNGLDCPYLDLGRLKSRYEEIAARNPSRLWRMMSLALWWKRCVLGEHLG